MSAQPVALVLESAEAAFEAGRWEEALAGFLSVSRAVPRYAPARFRVADALLNLGHRDRAKAVYRGLAWHHIRGGRPLSGLIATKMVLALDPELDDLLVILAELYSSESDRTGDVDAPEPAGMPGPDEEPVLAPGIALTGEALAEEAARLAADTDAITHQPELLPPIPLFSHLSEEAFVAVLGSLRLRRFADGEALIREGEMGDSFFMLAEGQVAVSRDVGGEDTLLARLSRGAVFGEMALVSRVPRVATVRAVGDVDVLELERAELESHAGQLESVKQALKKFTRGRFLANLAATSPLFEPLSRPDRRGLMGRFRPQRVFPGDIVIEQGAASPGLYLVLSGQMRVVTGAGAEAVDLATLRSGEVFGEISLLHDGPATATVAAESAGEILFLPREDFQPVIETYPAVAVALREMSAERLAEQRRAGARVSSDDSSVLL